jgi:hypothetical protein
VSGVWPSVKDHLTKLLAGSASGQDGAVRESCDAICALLPNHASAKALGTAQRSEIVRSAAKGLDSKDPLTLLKLAKVILRATKGGANLLAVSKLLFRLSKVSSNDALFLSEGLLPAILAALGPARVEAVRALLARGGEGAEAELEAAQLLAAALKNVTADSGPCRDALAGAGAVRVLSQWLEASATLSSPGDRGSGSGSGGRVRGATCALLAQAAAALRNLASSAGARGDLERHGAARLLLDVAAQWPGEVELQLNAARALAQLSLLPACRDELAAQPELADTALALLRRHRADAPLVVRWLFVLGSVTALSEDTRVAVAATPGALPLLAELLARSVAQLLAAIDVNEGAEEGAAVDGGPASGSAQGPGAHAREGPEQSSARAGGGGGGGGAAEVADVLVKLVRLLAHLAISPDVGPAVAREDAVGAELLRLLEALEMAEAEELLLNAVRAAPAGI